MGAEQVDETFTWVIKNFSSLQSEKNLLINSLSVAVIGKKRSRRVVAYSKRNNIDDRLSLALSLEVADAEDLPSGWRRHADFSFTIVNQISEQFSQLEGIFRCYTETRVWFDHKTRACDCASSFPLEKLEAKYGGFLVNGQVKIVAEVKVLAAIGMSDFINVYGFPVHTLEVELVISMFEKHQDVASEFERKNFNSAYKRACMYYLIGVIETLSKPPQEISRPYLVDARYTLEFVRRSGVKVDWVEKMLNEVTKEKEKE